MYSEGCLGSSNYVKLILYQGVVRMKKASLTAVLSIFVMLAICTYSSALTSDFTDISGHWAEDVIDKWAGYEVLTGSGDGRFRPSEYITRADLAIIICRVMNYQTVSGASFTDLGNCSEEQRTAILKLNAAGVMLGDGNNAMRPLERISRQEASVMIARAMQIKPVSSSTFAYQDMASISDWAYGQVMAMSEKGYLAGRGDGYFFPNAYITRAEVIKAIDNVIITGYFYQSGKQTISYLGNAIINTTGVELSQVSITGDLIITEGAGDGAVTLTDVTVEGTTYILGGSLKLNGNTRLGDVVHKRKGTSAITYTAPHTAIIDNLYIEPGTSPIQFTGAVRTIHMNAPNYMLRLTNAMAVNVNVNSYETTLVMDASSVVSNLDVGQTLKMIGPGSIQNVTIRPAGTGTSFDIQPKTVTVPTMTTVFLAGVTYANDTPGSQVYTNPTDGTSPTINDTQLTASKIGTDSITLTWKAAADNVTASSKLRYLLFYSSSPFMNTVADIEKNGYPTMAYTAAKLTGAATRLKPATRYYFNVIVMDEAGNKSCYNQLAVEIVVDETTPEILNRSITVTNIKQTGLTLSWERAYDNVTAQESLLYAVYQSETDNLNTALGCEQAGKQVAAPTADLTTAKITGLKEGTVYYFNIVVTDDSGNKSCYTQVSAMPIRDTVTPETGGYGVLSPTVTGSSITVSWDAGWDAATERSLLKYALYTSTANNIGTVDDIKKNGKASLALTANTLTYTLTGQKDGVYFFNVLIQDEAGNASCYNPIRVTIGTDTTAPTVPKTGLSLVGVTADTATLSWDAATDIATGIVGTDQENLTYTMYWTSDQTVYASQGSNFNTPTKIKNLSGVQSSGSYRNRLQMTATGLTHNTRYYFSVIVTDQAGNESCYTPFAVIVDVELPTVTSDSLVAAADTTKKTITISWGQATDTFTDSSKLTYTLYWSDYNLTSGISEMKNMITAIELSGKKLVSGTTYTVNKGAYTHTGLTVGMGYFYYLIVQDEAGNKFLYNAAGTSPTMPVILQ